MTLPAAYPESMATQIMVSGTWTDISAYRIGDLDMDWGIAGVMPADRTAKIGGMKLFLNNNDGRFTPNGVNAMAGFEKGAKVRFIIRYGRENYVRFKGKISGIGLPYKAGNISIIPVDVSDWFRSASKQRITTQGVEADVTTAEAARRLLENMSLQPDATDIQEGSETIEAFFTNVQPKSTVYSELSNLALSEFSYIYLKKDKVYGETLVIEGRHSRVGVQVTEFQKPLECLNWLTTENGVALFASENELLLADEMTTTEFQAMQEAHITYGETLINELTIKSNPSRLDESSATLFSLDAPIPIASGQTLMDFRVSYRHPSGGSQRINGANILPMVTGTHFQMFENVDGSGANLTSNLSFDVDFGSAGALFRNVTNNGGTSGYITKLDIDGNPVYLDNPIDYVLSDEPSINTFELSPYEIDNKYQSDPNVSETIAIAILNQNKNNRVVPQRIKICANKNAFLMKAFLNLDVGSLIPVVNSQYEFEGNRFIQSVKALIKQGGEIWFEWGLVDAYFANDVYWELEVAGKSELEQTTYVSY